MLKLFKKQPTNGLAVSTTLPLQLLCYPSAIDFERFAKGIDNVHIDVHLSPNFMHLSGQLIQNLLEERTGSKRRFTDKPSDSVCAKLDTFNSSYVSMLTAVIHRAKEGKRIDLVQLFQVAVLKFVLTTVNTQAGQLLQDLRKATTTDGTGQKKLDVHERITWINRNQNALLYQVTSEIFAQLRWAEKGAIKKLRESLLGVAWSIPEEMLFNPLLQSLDTYNHEVLMKHYVLLSQDPDSIYGFERVSEFIDNLLNHVIRDCQIQLDGVGENCTNSLSNEERSTEINFSWKDVPSNMPILFDMQDTLQILKESPEREGELKNKLLCQRRASKILEQVFSKSQVTLHLLAAYETPRLYEYYAKLLKSYSLYQALCDEIDIREVALKLQNQLKIRPLRRPGDKLLYIDELADAKKRLQKSAKNPDSEVLIRFMTAFVTYRRDLKFRRVIHEAMERIHLLKTDNDVQLSRTNGMLHEFLEQNEYTGNTRSIRGHVILKADLRGSTTMTAELCRRGLNPATHFSRNFFNPIRQLIDNFGAEKVFIEGDAIILSLFEYQNLPDQWLATARACGLAKNMLTVVHAQNQISLANNLPILELGMGICYSPEAPAFLYDGNQRIMISPAIGDADRLSSCSWKLRQKYANQANLLTHVMVFKQAADDAFKGEKGMSTFRYNLNGVELDSLAFQKLQNEIALRQLKIRLPGDEYPTYFYVGNYTDVKGESHEVVVREGRVLLWQENGDYYPPTDAFYYEVVVNKKILNSLRQLGA